MKSSEEHIVSPETNLISNRVVVEENNKRINNKEEFNENYNG